MQNTDIKRIITTLVNLDLKRIVLHSLSSITVINLCKQLGPISGWNIIASGLIRIQSVCQSDCFPERFRLPDKSAYWKSSKTYVVGTQKNRLFRLKYLLNWPYGEFFKCQQATICKFNNMHRVNNDMSRDIRFPTIWYVRPAKPQISLRIPAVWSEPLIVAWIFYDY